jgi:hypothetical protein
VTPSLTSQPKISQKPREGKLSTNGSHSHNGKDRDRGRSDSVARQSTKTNIALRSQDIPSVLSLSSPPSLSSHQILTPLQQKTEPCRPANNDFFSHPEPASGLSSPLPASSSPEPTAGEMETKVSVERSIPDRHSKSLPVPSSTSSAASASYSSLSYSGARLTHPAAILPPKLKFYGTSEYKDQFTNKGVIVSPAGAGGGGTRGGVDHHSHSPSQESSKLTTKKLREQSLTEQRSKYVWPADYLLHQHHEVRPKKSTSSIEKEKATAISAGELISSSWPSSSSPHPLTGTAGREEMKSLEPCEKKSSLQEGAQKSLIELDSIGSHLRDDSHFSSSTSSSSSHFHQQPKREKLVPSDQWTPTQNLDPHTSIEQLGEGFMSLSLFLIDV